MKKSVVYVILTLIFINLNYYKAEAVDVWVTAKDNIDYYVSTNHFSKKSNDNFTILVKLVDPNSNRPNGWFFGFRKDNINNTWTFILEGMENYEPVSNYYHIEKILDYCIENLLNNEKAAEENYKIGNKYRWDGNSVKAVEYLEKAVELGNYKNSVHLFVLGHAYFNNKQYQKSINSYNKALSLFKTEKRYGDVAKSYYLIGTCYERLNNKNAAIGAYKNAVAQNQDNDESKKAKQRISELEK